MKKFFFLLFLPTFMVLASCGGSSSDKAEASSEPKPAVSPRPVVENFLKAVKNFDVKTMTDAWCDEQGNPLVFSDYDIKDITNDTEFKELAKTFEYTILDEKIAEDGKTATIKTSLTTCSEDDYRLEKRFDCILCEDGKWRMKAEMTHLYGLVGSIYLRATPYKGD